MMLLVTDQKGESSQVNELEPAYALFRDQSRFWIQRVAVPLLMVIGLFGNAITVIIMTRRRMRSTTNLYLAALAFVDMLYLVLTFLLGLSHYPNMSSPKHHVYWRIKPFLMMFTDACSNTSVWITVTFTIERYIAVKYPMKGKVWCTEVRAKMLIVCVFTLGILFAAPVPFEWKVVEVKLNLTETTINEGSFDSKSSIREENSLLENNNNTFLALRNTDFGNNSTYKTIYYWLTAAIFYFIPLFSLMLFNGFLILSVHQSRRERTRMVTPSENPDYHSNANLTSSFALNVGGKNESISGQKVASSSSKDDDEYSCHSSVTKEDKEESDTKETVEKEGKTPCVPLINANGEGITIPNECTSGANVSNNLLKDSAIPERLSELNVQIVCDKDFVKSDEKNRGEVTLKNANQTTYTSIQKERTHAETGNKNLRGKVRTTGDLPITRSFSLKRTLTINSSSKSMTHPASLAPVSSQERRITIMLIAVVILFLVCQIPTAALLLYTAARNPASDSNEEALVLAFGNIFNFLMAVNAAGNFILYSFLSKKYRRTFISLFCRCFGSKQKHVGSGRTLSVRFETSGQSIRNSTSIHQNNKLIDKVQKDTLL